MEHKPGKIYDITTRKQIKLETVEANQPQHEFFDYNIEIGITPPLPANVICKDCIIGIGASGSLVIDFKMNKNIQIEADND